MLPDGLKNSPPESYARSREAGHWGMRNLAGCVLKNSKFSHRSFHGFTHHDSVINSQIVQVLYKNVNLSSHTVLKKRQKLLLKILMNLPIKIAVFTIVKIFHFGKNN